MVLREFIRSVLSEAMKGPDDLPDGYVVFIEHSAKETMVRIGLENVHNRALAVLTMDHSSSTGKCDGSWVVTTANAHRGWGPLAYDVAIEWATLHGDGLTPDRDSVSDDAYRVWDHYMRQRSDVKSYQLDSMTNILTPVDKDNCGQISTATHAAGKFEKDIAADDLKGSPLARRYTKAPTTINHLKKLGKLRVEH